MERKRQDGAHGLPGLLLGPLSGHESYGSMKSANPVDLPQAVVCTCHIDGETLLSDINPNK